MKIREEDEDKVKIRDGPIPGVTRRAMMVDPFGVVMPHRLIGALPIVGRSLVSSDGEMHQRRLRSSPTALLLLLCKAASSSLFENNVIREEGL